MRKFTLAIIETKGLKIIGDAPRKKAESVIPEEILSICSSIKIEPKFYFNVTPCPAPRMTKSDQWKTDTFHTDAKKRQRPCVTRYFKFRDELKESCQNNGYELTEVLDVMFIIEMPGSWSKKKKISMMGKPHKSRPDRDNYLKAFQDSFGGDDGFVWDGRTIKVWGNSAGIVVF